MIRFFVALLITVALMAPFHAIAAGSDANTLGLPELPDLPEDGSDALNLPDLSKVPEKPAETPAPAPVVPAPVTPQAEPVAPVPALPEPVKEMPSAAPAVSTPAIPALPEPTVVPNPTPAPTPAPVKEESTTKIDLPALPAAPEPVKAEEQPAAPSIPALPTLSKDQPFSTTIETITPPSVPAKKEVKKEAAEPVAVKAEEKKDAAQTLTRPEATEGDNKIKEAVPLDIPSLENPAASMAKTVKDYGVADAPDGECALFANHFNACDAFYCKTDHPTQKQTLLLEQKTIGKLNNICYFVQKKYEKNMQGCKATLQEGKSAEVTCSTELLEQLDKTLIAQIDEARKADIENTMKRIEAAGGATLAEQAADGTVTTKTPGEEKPFERKLSGNGVRPAMNYDTATLPESIYRQPHTGDNRDMPAVHTNNEFVAMTFSAIQRYDDEGLRALLPKIVSLGYNLNVQNPQGNTPLIQAVLSGNVSAMQILLGQGAKPDIQNREGLTALHIAAYGGRMDMVNILLQSGASTIIRDNYNRTASDLATQSKNAGMAQLLNR